MFNPYWILVSGVILALISTYLSLYYYNQNYIVIFPLFTASAYSPHGFYSYYANNSCITCLNVAVYQDDGDLREKFADNYNAQLIFRMMGFQVTDDREVTLNPNILENKTIILLHNEYISQQEFNAINESLNNNDRLIMFYPNSVYALVYYNTDYDTITLIGDKTHKTNYFSILQDNTSQERTNEGKPNYCNGQKFTYIGSNDYRLDCWVQMPQDIVSYIIQMENLK